MTYQPLHHKYRPQTFADLVGQDAIATTLANAIATGRIAPAYLFCGPRGTGKTSSARILAKSLNCQTSSEPTAHPCGTCDVCAAIARATDLDTIEIDAASNTGVDNIRELIERAQFAPVRSRYKVYLIDEVHMLSAAAFNALLKTLEEPPARVVFVLATTDPQRVLPTIISRCQRFDFRRIPTDEMVAHLQAIATREGIAIAPAALTLVAQVANGGLRDAESLLDQLSLLPGEIAPEAVWDLVGAVPERDLLALLQALRAGQPEAVLQQCRKLSDRGREPLVVLQNLAGFYRDLLVAKTASDRADLVTLTAPTWKQLRAEAGHWSVAAILQGQTHLKASEQQLRQTTQPRLWLEVTLLGLLDATATAGDRPAAELQPTPRPASTPSPPPAPRPAPQPAAETPRLAPPQSPPSPAEPAPTPVPAEAIASDPVASDPTPATPAAYPAVWKQVVATLQPATRALIEQHCHLIGIDFERGIARVGIKAAPLLKLAESKVKNIAAGFEQVCGHPIRVELSVAAPPARDDPPEPPASSDRRPVAPIPSPACEPTAEAVETAPTPTESSVAPRPEPPADETAPASRSLAPDTLPPDLEQAARSLADALDGEIVALTEVTDLPAATLPLDLGSNPAGEAISGNGGSLASEAADSDADEVPF